MGVPRFYRWLLEKYPKIVVNVEEEDDVPNTNGREFDNLYIQKLMTRILLIVRPRKLLFMSIGKSSCSGKEEARLRRQYDLQGRDLLSMEESEVSDSNVIAPGTEFMSELSEQLQTYIRMRISNHPTWKQLKVILSDANVPGEGEHKIMSFIRHQRTCPGYNPDTSHVLYGLVNNPGFILHSCFTVLYFLRSVESCFTNFHHLLNWFIYRRSIFLKLSDYMHHLQDTDLIMLALASHEVHFSILRHQDEFLHVWILREYLNLDFKMMNMPENFESDSERLIDDFIFICFFAGNDFLPQMPTLNIYEGAIDLLIQVYKEEFQNLGGYLIDVQRVNDRNGGYINLKRVEKFILAVGTYEDEIFKKRSRIHERKLRRMISEDARGNGEENYLAVGSDGNSSCIVRPPDHNVIVENTKMLKRELKSYARERSYLYRNGRVTDLVEKYAEGLCWVLLYYFSDAPSWTWYDTSDRVKVYTLLLSTI
ncbi:5'-3' exoribonuclease [Cynara cardunculus var. scolymus]|uniref:5'-3' exoribonuclease n=1 Tax=Cynara cardunculus var. scolymus TaxID=59895 RepID=A0A103XIA7_CYNCS|nr:5'-3' exoribonuclease [Cynara cardunculus var. scolymus]